jgi:hypothetical protein
MLLADFTVCISSLCGCVPCEVWLWAVLALGVYKLSETGG